MKIVPISLLSPVVLGFCLGSKSDEFSTDEASSGQVSTFINYPQGRDNKVEHLALLFFPQLPSRKALNGCKAVGKQTAAING